jgi:D-alanine-D-alanine ligase
MESSTFNPAVPLGKLKVWVLAPHLLTNDTNLDYYYDFSQSIDEFDATFKSLNIPWQWQAVTIDDYTSVLDDIAMNSRKEGYMPLIFNLCDGDEINGTPGLSVVKHLDKSRMVYTGAEEFFYHITTSKISMKEAFDASGVPTAKWEPIRTNKPILNGIFKHLGSPIILKPAVSAGSMGVGIKNVVHNNETLSEQVSLMYSGYRGWNLAGDGLIAEQFVTGPEFTTLVTGSYYNPSLCKVYTAVERVFHDSLPDTEKFLSFDRLWEIYEDEKPMPGEENFFEYQQAPEALQEKLKDLSIKAYMAVKGTGYARIDIRMDQQTGELFVLEVNAQCGLSEDENYTSIGAILRLSGNTFNDLVIDIINDAFIKYGEKWD